MQYTDQQIEDGITALMDRGQNKAVAVRTVLRMMAANISNLVIPVGAHFLFGSGVPTSAKGVDGDVYDNIITGDRYSKDAGVWSFQYRVKGDPGRTPVKGQDYSDGYTPRKNIDYRDGLDGKNNYELWLQAGNIGTLATFLAWLRNDAQSGADGKDGTIYHVEIYDPQATDGSEGDIWNTAVSLTTERRFKKTAGVWRKFYDNTGTTVIVTPPNTAPNVMVAVAGTAAAPRFTAQAGDSDGVQSIFVKVYSDAAATQLVTTFGPSAPSDTSYITTWTAAPAGNYYAFAVATDIKGLSATSTPGVAFTVGVALLAPTITSFTPAAALSGALINVTGTNLSNITAASFNGTAVAAGGITNNTATGVTLLVPATAATGFLSLTTAGGTALSAAAFTVNSAPVSTVPVFWATAVNSLSMDYGFNLQLTANTSDAANAMVLKNWTTPNSGSQDPDFSGDNIVASRLFKLANPNNSYQPGGVYARNLVQFLEATTYNGGNNNYRQEWVIYSKNVANLSVNIMTLEEGINTFNIFRGYAATSPYTAQELATMIFDKFMEARNYVNSPAGEYTRALIVSGGDILEPSANADRTALYREVMPLVRSQLQAALPANELIDTLADPHFAIGSQEIANASRIYRDNYHLTKLGNLLRLTLVMRGVCRYTGQAMPVDLTSVSATTDGVNVLVAHDSIQATEVALFNAATNAQVGAWQLWPDFAAVPAGTYYAKARPYVTPNRVVTQTGTITVSGTPAPTEEAETISYANQVVAAGGILSPAGRAHLNALVVHMKAQTPNLLPYGKHLVHNQWGVKLNQYSKVVNLFAFSNGNAVLVESGTAGNSSPNGGQDNSPQATIDSTVDNGRGALLSVPGFTTRFADRVTGPWAHYLRAKMPVNPPQFAGLAQLTYREVAGAGAYGDHYTVCYMNNSNQLTFGGDQTPSVEGFRNFRVRSNSTGGSAQIDNIQMTSVAGSPAAGFNEVRLGWVYDVGGIGTQGAIGNSSVFAGYALTVAQEDAFLNKMNTAV